MAAIVVVRPARHKPDIQFSPTNHRDLQPWESEFAGDCCWLCIRIARNEFASLAHGIQQEESESLMKKGNDLSTDADR